jgi:hypothetical protein
LTNGKITIISERKLALPPMKTIWISPKFTSDEVQAILKNRSAFEGVFQAEEADILIFKNLSEIQSMIETPFKEGVKIIYTQDDTKHINPVRIPFELLPNTLASL